MKSINAPASTLFDIAQTACQDFVSGFTNKEEFIKQFRLKYSLVLAYHATNISQQEQDDILATGIVVSSDDFLKGKALARFIHPNDTSEIQQKIRQEIESNFDERVFVEKKIFFTHLKQELIEESTQYLLYGAETLLPLADRLRDRLRINFRQRMIEHGDPCIIHATIPTLMISNRDIGEIYEHLVNDWIECCLECRDNIPDIYIRQIEKVRRPVNIYEN